MYELWGDLVDQEPGREPMPKEKLVRLFREIANYIVSLSLPHARYVRLTSSRSKSECQQRALSSLPKRWSIFMQLMLWRMMII